MSKTYRLDSAVSRCAQLCRELRESLVKLNSSGEWVTDDNALIEEIDEALAEWTAVTNEFLSGDDK